METQAKLIDREKPPNVTAVYAVINGRRYELPQIPELYILPQDFFGDIQWVDEMSLVSRRKREKTAIRNGRIFRQYAEDVIKMKKLVERASIKDPSIAEILLPDYKKATDLLDRAQKIVFVETEERYHACYPRPSLD